MGLKLWQVDDAVSIQDSPGYQVFMSIAMVMRAKFAAIVFSTVQQVAQMRNFVKHGILTQIHLYKASRIARQPLVADNHTIDFLCLFRPKVIYFHFKTCMAAVELLNFIQSRHSSNRIEVCIILWSIRNDDSAFALKGNIDIVQGRSND